MRDYRRATGRVKSTLIGLEAVEHLQRLRDLLKPGATHVLVDAGDLRSTLDDLEAAFARAPHEGGRPPYGWEAWRGELRASIGEQRTLRLIASLRAGVNTWAEIAEHLNEAQIPTRSGQPWTARSVASVTHPAHREAEQ